MTEKLSEVQQKVESLEKDRVRAQSELGEQLKQLREGVGSLANEAGGLSAALRKPMGRGSWGEVQLRNVVELAGMIEHCDFETQVTVEGDEGRLRPDVTVNMPGGQIVVIDAKAPMEAFLEAQEAVNEDVRAELLAQHAHQVRNHINILRNKKYQDQFDQSPELVVMFVPSEGIYHAALAEDSGLLEYGLKEKVLIATPTTLIGLLRAIYYGWGQDRIARSAQEIADTGRELHKRILTFAEPLNKVGKSLGQATDSYNQAISFLRSAGRAAAPPDRGRGREVGEGHRAGTDGRDDDQDDRPRKHGRRRRDFGTVSRRRWRPRRRLRRSPGCVSVSPSKRPGVSPSRISRIISIAITTPPIPL